MKGLPVVFALVSVLILLFGCAGGSSKSGGNQGELGDNSSYQPNQSPPPLPNQGENATPQPPPEPPAKVMAGSWTGTATEQLHGPQGGIPEACTIKQTVTFDISQDGDSLSGTMSTTLDKIIDCSGAVPESWIGMKVSGPIKGTLSGSNAVFSMEQYAELSAVNFTATLQDGVMSGDLETCHSPDPRCTCRAPDKRCPGGVDANGAPLAGMLQTMGWWTGNFTVARAK